MPLKLYQRSKLKQTAAALNSVPSWNFTFLRRLNVQVMPSGLGCQVSASAGTTSVPPCFVVTRPSKICRIGRNDSPSLTYAGSKLFGSADAPKTRAALPPPPLDFEPVPPSAWLSTSIPPPRRGAPAHCHPGRGQDSGRWRHREQTPIPSWDRVTACLNV